MHRSINSTTTKIRYDSNGCRHRCLIDKKKNVCCHNIKTSTQAGLGPEPSHTANSCMQVSRVYLSPSCVNQVKYQAVRSTKKERQRITLVSQSHTAYHAQHHHAHLAYLALHNARPPRLIPSTTPRTSHLTQHHARHDARHASMNAATRTERTTAQSYT